MNTLKQRRDFLAARNGARYHGRDFVLQCVRRETNGDVRFGLTVTKRLGNAVVRNRIKRRLRAVIGQVQGDLPQDSAGLDIVIIARINAINAPFDTLQQDLLKGIERLVAKDRAKGQ